MFAYRRKSVDQVGKQPKLSTQAMLGWLIIPSALFLADDIFLFAKAWDLHDNYRKVPANAYEIKVTGSLWSWTYEYPNGVTSSNELVVPVGGPVLLRMTSTDVIHSHYMNRYRVTEDVVPGRVTYQWFLPDEVGESVVTCREYCGMLHSGMYGKIKVVDKQEFDTWMNERVASAAGHVINPSEVAVVTTLAESL
jgi:cytochrome c oxidase subunit 2